VGFRGKTGFEAFQGGQLSCQARDYKSIAHEWRAPGSNSSSNVRHFLLRIFRHRENAEMVVNLGYPPAPPPPGFLGRSVVSLSAKSKEVDRDLVNFPLAKTKLE
jgi:hypothetical protein